MLRPIPFRLPSPDDGVDGQAWKASLMAWRSILRSYLALQPEHFRAELKASDALPNFLVSYIEVLSKDPHGKGIYQPTKDLHRDCFLSIHRMWSLQVVPSSLLLPAFLVHFCIVFGSVKGSSETIDRLWKSQHLASTEEMLQHKLSIQLALESTQQAHSTKLNHALSGMRAFIKTSHAFGHFLMIGADFLDALITAWNQGDTRVQNKITTITYAAFLTLMGNETGALSTLADHIYTLRMDHEKAASGTSLLLAMITTTPFLFKYRKLTLDVKSARIADMLPVFERIGRPPARRYHIKGKAVDLNGDRETHVVQMEKMSQVQDLFPDLGAGFIARLLEEYEQNPELATQHLLDNSIPSHFQAMDREESIESYRKLSSSELGPRLALKSSRHNVYDYDDLDELEIAAGKLHIGKKQDDEILAQPANKASILSALAALDPDDDERDDTYDAEDVGGTVDMVKPDDDLVDRDDQQGEEQLFTAWMTTPEVFGRESSTRTSAERKKLRDDTKLTDEAIEGWAIMLQREPQRLRRLQAQYALPSMLQPELASSSWKSGAESDQDDHRGSRRGGGARGRGRNSHRGNRGRGGTPADAAGPSDDAGTQRARHRKDANKSTRANHGRRDQRAKKVARAGF